MVRMVRCANSSQQPGCTPANAAIGKPASWWKMIDGAKLDTEVDVAAAPTIFAGATAGIRT